MAEPKKINGKKESFKERLDAVKLAVRMTYESSKSLTVISIIVMILGGLLNLTTPYLFKLLIDRVLSGDGVSSEIKTGLFIIGILILYGLSNFLQIIFWDAANLIKKMHMLRLERQAAYDLMKNISSLDISYFEDAEYHDNLSKATNNIYRIIEVSWQFTFLISEVVAVIAIIAALAVYDVKIILIILASAIPGIIFALKSAEVLWSAFTQASPIHRHAIYYKSLLTEDAQSIKEIKSFGLQQLFLEKFKNLFNEFIKAQDGAAKTQLKWYVLIAVFEGGLSVVAAWLVIQSFIKGEISIGTLTFLWALLFQFAAHTRWLVRTTSEMNTNATFLTSIVKVMNYKPKIKNPVQSSSFPKKIVKGIEFRNVTFYYPKAKKASLKNVNVTIKPGESVALVGENGSGKTTLIKLLSRLYDVTDGEILIDGKNIKEYALDDLYEHIGVIFQDFMKYEAEVRENIGFGRLERMSEQGKIHGSAVKSGAWQFIKNLEKKYETSLGKKLKDDGIEFSIGQWQKMALARAFFRDANILILDEPTAAVDAKAEYALFQKFRHLTKDKITFLISHRFSTVRMAHRIIVIDKGRIIEEGSHAALMKKDGTYAKLFKLQAEGYK